MSTLVTKTLTTAPVRYRALHARDLPGLLRILRQQTEVTPALARDLREALQAGEMRGRVAESQKRLVGFALCVLDRTPCKPPGRGRRLLARFFPRLLPRRAQRMLRIERLEIALDPEWQRPEVERELVGQLEHDLEQFTERIEIVVPETSLPAQLCLREAGYRATEVLRGYYGTEDGYRMVRQPS